ncbi:sialidase family protein [Actinoalloteichus hymeniacidonis]|uniref:exo-alpha-sialidase n=1 Tax=Actinoalloteichus hymeniacidonis TaxID=340345 RepID=A0AAC9HPZ5_9PSEU|nr:sialidase family protein [Actinoalloteichus hymeniacidonis]AOS63203.1 BNR repeat-like domain [Actinoalloteichus hymeniacidonis]MBB5908760.1 sialidase-1 [Actinoalloteichus hymeniacidonis]
MRAFPRAATTLLAAALLFCATGLPASADPGSARPGSERPGRPYSPTEVYVSGTEGYDTFRIPAIIRASNGDLLAFAEGRRDGGGDSGDIDLVLKRSTNDGRTWGALTVVGDNGPNTFGNPSPVVDPATGRIVLLSTHNGGTVTEHEIRAGEVDPADSRRVWVQHSEDDGRTWTEPREITEDTKLPEWRWYATGPVHAIALSRGQHAGRLVVPANHSSAPPEGSPDTGIEDRYYDAHLIYSDDGGLNWTIGAMEDTPDGAVNGNETTIAELPDGRIYVNSRNQNGTAPGNRLATYSSDGGAGFDEPLQPVPDLLTPVVQGSVLQIEDGPLLLAAPSNPDRRERLAVRSSHDDGASWSDGVVLSEAPAAYSDLVPLHRGGVGVYYETGVDSSYETISFQRLSARDLR